MDQATQEKSENLIVKKVLLKVINFSTPESGLFLLGGFRTLSGNLPYATRALGKRRR